MPWLSDSGAVAERLSRRSRDHKVFDPFLGHHIPGDISICIG